MITEKFIRHVLWHAENAPDENFLVLIDYASDLYEVERILDFSNISHPTKLSSIKIDNIEFLYCGVNMMSEKLRGRKIENLYCLTKNIQVLQTLRFKMLYVEETGYYYETD